MSLTVNFSKRIFTKEAVEAAISDYNEFASFEINDEGEKMQVNIDDLDYDAVDEFIGEFKNYVIFKMGVKQ